MVSSMRDRLDETSDDKPRPMESLTVAASNITRLLIILLNDGTFDTEC